MKKILYFFAMAFILSSITACETKEAESSDSMEDLIARLKPTQRVAWTLDIPSGSKITQKDGNVQVQFPEQVTAYCYDIASGTWITTHSLNYKCDCISGKQKCEAMTAEDKVGCSTDISNPCATCQGTVIDNTDKGIDPRQVGTIIYQYESPNSGYVALMALGSHIIPALSFSDLQNLRQATEAEIRDTLVMKDIRSLLDEIKDQYEGYDFTGDQLPEGFGLVPFIVSKHVTSENPEDFSIVYVVLPKKEIKDGMMEVTQVRYFSIQDDEAVGHTSKSKVSCSGSCEGGNCVLKSYFLGKVKVCEGCNSGCTIHIE